MKKNSVWAKFVYTASDGKDYQVDFYNLDVIISVGYRVKSLKDYVKALEDMEMKLLGEGK